MIAIAGCCWCTPHGDCAHGCDPWAAPGSPAKPRFIDKWSWAGHAQHWGGVMTPLSEGGCEPVHTDRSPSVGEPIVVSGLDRRERRASPFLAADIGGTHARIGLVVPHAATGRPDIVAYKSYRCAEYASLVDILRNFCRAHAV